MPGTGMAVDRALDRSGSFPDHQPSLFDVRPRHPGLTQLILELGRGGSDRVADGGVGLVALSQEIDFQLDEVADQESEQPVPPVVGVPTRVGAEEVPEGSPDGSSCRHRAAQPSRAAGDVHPGASVHAVARGRVSVR